MPPLSEEYLKSVSESQLRDRAYTPYELERHERDSLEEIKKSLKKGDYKTTGDVQDSLNFVESLANKINMAVNNEKKDGKTTWELEADLTEMKSIFDQLDKLLQSMETKEVENLTKKNIRRRR